MICLLRRICKYFFLISDCSFDYKLNKDLNVNQDGEPFLSENVESCGLTNHNTQGTVNLKVFYLNKKEIIAIEENLVSSLSIYYLIYILKRKLTKFIRRNKSQKAYMN